MRFPPPTLLVVGFQYLDDARRFLSDLRERFAKFGLELHPDKTRLIEFGRFAAQNRRKRGLGKPETFDFLGFTHMCGKTRNGRFWLRRITITKRMGAKLRRSKTELRRRRHLPIPEQGRWLASVVRGHRAYYAVPGNSQAVNGLPHPGRQALVAGASASQPASPPELGPDEPARCPMVASCPHRASLARACASTPEPKAGAQCGSSARWDLCGGPPARAVPTAISPKGRESYGDGVPVVVGGVTTHPIGRAGKPDRRAKGHRR